MLRGKRWYFKRGATWLTIWLASTMLIYTRNMLYLVENAGTKRNQFPWVQPNSLEKSGVVYNRHEQTPTSKETLFRILKYSNAIRIGVQQVTRNPNPPYESLLHDSHKQKDVLDKSVNIFEVSQKMAYEDPLSRNDGENDTDKYILRDLKRRPRINKDGLHERNRRNITRKGTLHAKDGSNLTNKGVFHARVQTDNTPHLQEEQNILNPKEKLFGKQSQKLILFYKPSNFQIVRNLTNITYTFENCSVRNCRVSFNQTDATKSDAVLFHWFINKQFRSYPNFTRPKNQIWIFVQHEPTRSYARNSTEWPFYYPGLKNNFNWTMTYSRLSDIQLPYGKIKRKPDNIGARNYLDIAKSKTKDALWVVSKCPTAGRREEYVNILKQYIDVEILGACGRNWSCGVRSNHPLDNCFSILNKTYRYYLAFENDLCDDYVSEKFYENYEYDLLQVVRAGHPLRRSIGNIGKDAYIDTKDFKGPHELGKYLQNLSQNVTQYAKMLAVKDKYEVVSYQELFQKSLCGVCERLNNLKKYRRVYDDVSKWMHKREPCYGVKDL